MENENQDLSVQDTDTNGGAIVTKEDNFNVTDNTVSEKEKSYFDGESLEYLGVIIVTDFLISLGITAPWGICRFERWKARHTTIEGKRLKFIGGAESLLGHWIKWLLLSFVTFGIYLPWLYIDVVKWNTKNTLCEDKEALFDGKVLDLIGTIIICSLIVIFSLGFATPWAVCRFYRWKNYHTIVDGKRLMFIGTAESLLGHWIKWFLLTMVTFGIYSFWAYVNMNKWLIERTVFDDGSYEQNPPQIGINFEGIKEFLIRNKILVASLAAIFIIVPIVISRCSASDNYDEENILGLRPDEYYENMYAAGAGEYALQGFIDGKYPITMKLSIDENGGIYGTYYYDKVGTDIYLHGTINSDYDVFMEESTDVNFNNLTGSFSGFLDVNTSIFSGTFHGYERDNRLSFSLTQ